jgi:hypothetical protein
MEHEIDRFLDTVRGITIRVTGSGRCGPAPLTQFSSRAQSLHCLARTLVGLSLLSRHIGQWNRTEFSITVSRAVIGTAVT